MGVAAHVRDTEQEWKRRAAVAFAVVAVALALWSLYRSYGPQSQWGSGAPRMVPGISGGPAPTPAPMPPPR